jgi:NADPH:quinone reductase-like Zn-dependent oxidoreductase
MRYEFLDEHIQKIKKFAQPLLDEQTVLVAVQYIFFPSEDEFVSACATSFNNTISLPQKIRTVFDRAIHTQSIEQNIKNTKSSTYSFSGHVIAAGTRVSTLRPGDAIACIGTGDPINTDLACIHEYDAVILSDHSYIKQASITGFSLLAMHAILRAKLQVGYVVCVVGFDALGYLIMQLAKLSGTTVIVVDDNPTNIINAKTAGAHHCYNSTEHGWQEEVLRKTQRHGVDVTFVIKNTIGGITSEVVIAMTRAHGRIVLVGLDDIHIDLSLEKKILIL